MSEKCDKCGLSRKEIVEEFIRQAENNHTWRLGIPATVENVVNNLRQIARKMDAADIQEEQNDGK